MQTLKLSYLWNPFFEETVIYHLIKKLSKKKIEITSPSKADLLIIGPYNLHTYTRKIFNSIKKIIDLEKYFKNIDLLSLRLYQPLKILNIQVPNTNLLYFHVLSIHKYLNNFLFH